MFYFYSTPKMSQKQTSSHTSFFKTDKQSPRRKLVRNCEYQLTFDECTPLVVAAAAVSKKFPGRKKINFGLVFLFCSFTETNGTKTFFFLFALYTVRPGDDWWWMYAYTSVTVCWWAIYLELQHYNRTGAAGFCFCEPRWVPVLREHNRGTTLMTIQWFRNGGGTRFYSFGGLFVVVRVVVPALIGRCRSFLLDLLLRCDMFEEVVI